MQKQRIKEILLELMPYVAAAGDYALAIQAGVENRAPKDHLDSAFAQALTDADLSVQNFLEVVTLARFPEIGFFGEEHEQSVNTKYLPDGKKLTLLVDPIDGTRFYADKRPYFNVVLSLVDDEWYQFGIIYIPALRVCYYALAGEGLYRASSEEMATGTLGQRYALEDSSETILSYRTPAINKVLKEQFTVLDIDEQYERDSNCPNINGVFLGKALAYIGENNSAIDWGVHAFLLEEGGGRASDWSGASLPKLSSLNDRRFPRIVASVNKKRHVEILSLIQGLNAK